MAVDTRSNVDQEIRTLMDGFAKAVREKHLDALMAHYAPELVVFNVVPPLRDKGIEVNRKSWREFRQLQRQHRLRGQDLTARSKAEAIRTASGG